MKPSDEQVVKIHGRLFKDIQRHISDSSFESPSAFIHHVMADIVTTGEMSMGGNVPKEEAELVRKRLEALGYLGAPSDTYLIPAHGGFEDPVDCQVPYEQMAEFIREAKTLPAYHISREDLCMLYRFGDGVLSPLDGPMLREDFEGVLDREVIHRDGIDYAWTLPLAFSVDEDKARSLQARSRLAIIDDKNDIVGILTVGEVYPWDKPKFLKSIYGTDRADHAGARKVLADRRDWLLGGKVEVLPEKPNPLLRDLIMPAWKTRELCQNRRWERVVACHADSPLTRAEEYGLIHGAELLTREGHLTGVVINPSIDSGSDNPVPPETRMNCFRVLTEKRILGKGDKDVALWKEVGFELNDQSLILGLDMKRFHAGPKEAVMHAIYRQNLGFTHMVVNPDHEIADFDDGTPLFKEFEAQEKFNHLKGELRIEALPVGHAAYFAELGRVALVKDHEDRGWTPLRMTSADFLKEIEAGNIPDPRMVRPEVARLVKSDHDLYKSSRSTNVTWHHASVTKEDREALNDHRGICMWFTGLSASGKSSVAQAVEGKLYERGIRTYVLDGDNVRHGLNANLGFSPEDREENIRRIGHVAKLFAEGGMVVMTAFISPYRKDRDCVRDLMEPGDFLEVFIDCPVEICEQRDPKGLYKKARAGQIPEFTGISAPYEEPEKPELHIAAGDLSIVECADEVVKYLEENNLISRR